MTLVRHPVLRAVIVFTVLMALFYGIVHAPDNKVLAFESHLRLLASWTGSVLVLCGHDATVNGRFVGSSEFSFEVVRGCDAIEPTAVFVSAVLASPASLGPKVLGILVGALSLFLLNFVRIIGLFFVGLHFRNAFEFVHEDICQTAFLLLAVMGWTVWGLWARRSTPRLRHARG
jgi:exosortase/archaeosortase family protein